MISLFCRKQLISCVERQLLGKHSQSILQKGTSPCATLTVPYCSALYCVVQYCILLYLHHSVIFLSFASLLSLACFPLPLPPPVSSSFRSSLPSSFPPSLFFSPSSSLFSSPYSSFFLFLLLSFLLSFLSLLLSLSLVRFCVFPSFPSLLFFFSIFISLCYYSSENKLHYPYYDRNFVSPVFITH